MRLHVTYGCPIGKPGSQEHWLRCSLNKPPRKKTIGSSSTLYKVPGRTATPSWVLNPPEYYFLNYYITRLSPTEFQYDQLVPDVKISFLHAGRFLRFVDSEQKFSVEVPSFDVVEGVRFDPFCYLERLFDWIGEYTSGAWSYHITNGFITSVFTFEKLIDAVGFKLQC